MSIERDEQAITPGMQPAVSGEEFDQILLGSPVVGSAAVSTEVEITELITPLQPIEGLNFVMSHNTHRYDRADETVSEVLRSIPDRGRTSKEQEIAESAEFVRTFIRGRYFPYESALFPEELVSLASELAKFSKKSRPDFEGLEGDIIDNAVSFERATMGGKLTKKTQGILDRSRQNEDRRTGMQWETLNELAAMAADHVRTRTHGKFKSAEDFFPISDIIDPDPKTSVDLSGVFDYIITSKLSEIIAERASDDGVRQAREQAFVENVGIIRQWFDENENIISELPPRNELIPRDALKTMDRFVGHMGPAEILRTALRNLNTRLEGSETKGFLKSYKENPAGALSATLRVKHLVDTINKYVEEFNLTGGVGVDITPDDLAVLLDEE